MPVKLYISKPNGRGQSVPMAHVVAHGHMYFLR